MEGTASTYEESLVMVSDVDDCIDLKNTGSVSLIDQPQNPLTLPQILFYDESWEIREKNNVN